MMIAVALLLGYVGISIAFEVDGFKSGMVTQEAHRLLETHSYGKLEIKEDRIIAWDYGEKDYNRFINLGFCEGKLVQIEKHVKARFDYFTRLVDEKTRELGKPMNAWSRPAKIASNVESNSIVFLWKDGSTFVIVEYTEFASNNQLAITYETDNKCWKTPY